MTNSDMQLLKVLVEDEVFQILTLQALFQIFLDQIFLMIFLMDLEEVEGEEEEDLQILEVQT